MRVGIFRMYILLSWTTPELAVPTGIARKGEDSARVHVRGNRTVTEPMVFISCSQCLWDPWEMSPFLMEPKARLSFPPITVKDRGLPLTRPSDPSLELYPSCPLGGCGWLAPLGLFCITQGGTSNHKAQHRENFL